MKLLTLIFVAASILAASPMRASADDQWYDTSKRSDLWRY
jgi:hypothetical protein